MENDELQFRIMPALVTGAITHIEQNSHEETKRASLDRVTTSADGVEKAIEIEL
jgi:hypothetical protein